MKKISWKAAPETACSRLSRPRRALSTVAAILIAMPAGVYAADMDGDGRGDLLVYDSAQGIYAASSTAQASTLAYEAGESKDFPVPGQYSSTVGDDLAVWRPSNGTWYIRLFDLGANFNSGQSYVWGKKGDKPHPCDFSGDGLDELTVFRKGRWLSRISNAATPASTFTTATSIRWGRSSDVPIPYDFDSDGVCDYTVFRDGLWRIALSSASFASGTEIEWGRAKDIPVPGQYTADSIADIAVFRQRKNSRGGPLWIIRSSELAGLTDLVVQHGRYRDIPVPMDTDGDGKTDLVTYRPSDGTWNVRPSSTGYTTAQSFQFGGSSDIPIGDRRGKDPR